MRSRKTCLEFFSRLSPYLGVRYLDSSKPTSQSHQEHLANSYNNPTIKDTHFYGRNPNLFISQITKDKSLQKAEWKETLGTLSCSFSFTLLPHSIHSAKPFIRPWPHTSAPARKTPRRGVGRAGCHARQLAEWRARSQHCARAGLPPGVSATPPCHALACAGLPCGSPSVGNCPHR